MKYAFIKQHEDHHPAKLMCQVMGIHPSGYYAWKKQPVSARAKDNQRLLGLIKQSWLESGCVYGYRKVYDDMMDLSETCSENRVQRLMHKEGLKAQVGYKKHRYIKGGKPAVVAPNHIQRQFDVKTPNNTWVTDITYIRTYEGGFTPIPRTVELRVSPSVLSLQVDACVAGCGTVRCSQRRPPWLPPGCGISDG